MSAFFMFGSMAVLDLNDKEDSENKPRIIEKIQRILTSTNS